jgi:hypothetical protein
MDKRPPFCVKSKIAQTEIGTAIKKLLRKIPNFFPGLGQVDGARTLKSLTTHSAVTGSWALKISVPISNDGHLRTAGGVPGSCHSMTQHPYQQFLNYYPKPTLTSSSTQEV